MRVSILIVNWNSKTYLRQALRSILTTCTEMLPQVVVVDNGSFDGSAELVATEFPEVDFVQSPINLGFGRANNLGFERVQGDVVLLLNPDAELQPGALRTMLVALHNLPQVGVVGPKILNDDGSLQTSCVRAQPTPLNQALDAEVLRKWFPTWRGWGNWKAFHATGEVEVECLSGACMLLRADVFRKVGGFSPEFFMYGEDVDLCFKVRHLGLRLYYVPGATVVHHGGRSAASQFKKFPIVAMREADLLVVRKWGGKRAAACYRLLMGLSALVRLPLLLLNTLARLRMGWWKAGGASVLKWWSIFRWSIGFERWASDLYRGGPPPLKDATKSSATVATSVSGS